MLHGMCVSREPQISSDGTKCSPNAFAKAGDAEVFELDVLSGLHGKIRSFAANLQLYGVPGGLNLVSWRPDVRIVENQ